MGLPKIETPKYDLTLPLSKTQVKYRPFVVREQKILLQANEMSGDKSQMTNALDDVIKACTFNELEIETLPVADVEYLLLMIRAKSVGEVVDMTYKCGADVEGETCDNRIPVQLNLTSVGIDLPEDREYKLVFNNDVGVTLKEITYGEWKAIIASSSDPIEAGYNTIMACIKNVFDAEQVYDRKDFTLEELKEFLDQLYPDDFEAIEKFAETMPQVHKNIDITCNKCGASETIELRGLNDFLE